MTARDTILATVRKNLPRPAVPLPDVPGTDRKGIKSGFGYKEHFNRLPEVPGFPDEGAPILPYFRKQLEAMGGRSFEVQGVEAARGKVAELFPAAKVVCSAVPEVPGTRRVQDVKDPHELNDVDVGVVRSPLAVAEAGAVWLTQGELVVNALGVLSQHLVVLLDPAAIVDTMHDAYGHAECEAACPKAIPLEFIAGLNRDLIRAAFRRRREPLAIVGAPRQPAHEDT